MTKRSPRRLCFVLPFYGAFSFIFVLRSGNGHSRKLFYNRASACSFTAFSICTMCNLKIRTHNI